ncbi:cyclic nucleotide-binding domain-containing protein [Duganella sp. FT134W]|uniref:Cyclic nucleotide-binding domain-containing protein n=1 Tax=Duganella margarita TaxID=2692170 RepID=A0A7X4H097_9BURK|nr:Crp/Fnr family transcriptional regulator [Duganella margarita]MYM71834.1 cyclic nucleotide-binding domain-containing protein [Duganella margarita]
MSHRLRPVTPAPADSIRRCHGCPLNVLCLDELPEDAERSAPCMEQRCIRLRGGEHLFRVSDAVDQHLYIIRQGDIKLYQHGSDGGQHIIEFLGPGAWVGLESLNEHQRHAGAVALTDCEIATVPYTLLTALLDRQPRSAEAFGQLLSGTIARHQQHAAMLRSTSAIQRVAQFLLHRLEQAQGVAQGLARATLPMSRQDIADYLGLTSSTVSRCLSVLRRHGWLAMAQRAYTLPGLRDVEKVAAGAPLALDA